MDVGPSLGRTKRRLCCFAAFVGLAGLLYEYFILGVNDPHRSMLSGFVYGAMFGGFACAAWFAGRPREQDDGPSPFSKTPLRSWVLCLAPFTMMVIALLKKGVPETAWPSWGDWVVRLIGVGAIVAFVIAAKSSMRERTLLDSES